MRLSLLANADWLFLIILPIMGVGVALGLSVSAWAHPFTIFALWAFMGLWVGVSAVLLLERGNLNRIKRYYSQHNVWVGWTQDKYKVDLGEVDALIAQAIYRMAPTYPEAWKALTHCTVVFREPEWIQLETLRRVRGEQDGPLLVVGWAPVLSGTALLHELGHRILQVCASIPGEEEGHRELVKFGFE